MSTEHVTAEGVHLIDSWKAAQQELERARSAVNRASCELSNAASALAKWMLPTDCMPGEKICVWHLDSLIQVQAPDNSATPAIRDPVISIRKRGKQYL